MSVSRRTFLASLAAVVPLSGLVRRAHAAAVAHLEADPATLAALAETVLPSSLGKAGIAAEARALREWAAGYHEGAELVHSYGTSRLRTLGPTPLTRWSAQLDELDGQARAQHQRRFHELPLAQREALVRAALQGQRLDRMPATGDANHVAVAVLAHFYESAHASDLCYGATIGKNTCRPLASSAKKPLPLLKVSER